MNQQLLGVGCDTSTASSLLVRLLSPLFGDDTNMWPDNAFQKWVLHHTTAETLPEKLIELFEAVCNPKLGLALSNKGKYAGTEYANFRRIDGMHMKHIEPPALSEESRQRVLNAGNFDWGRVNPGILRAMFQQLVDLDDLCDKDEHYTNKENILKVIEPLFPGDLRAHFEEAHDNRTALLALQDEIAGLVSLNPTRGYGSFLIQACKQLRGLEFEIIIRTKKFELAEIHEALNFHAQGKRVNGVRALRQRLLEIGSGNVTQYADQALRKSRMGIRQSYGIEISQWPARVASTTMLLMDHLCNQAFGQSVVRLPTEETPEIVNANTPRIDWTSVIAPEDCDYITGNPPFVGYSRLNDRQKQDRTEVLGRRGGIPDFVAYWHHTATGFLSGYGDDVVFVSTSSICQGQQVAPLWEPVFDMGCRVNSARRPSVWNGESEHATNVYCAITAFSRNEWPVKRAWDYTTREVVESQPAYLNGYLVDATSVFIKRRSKPLSEASPVTRGSQSAGKPLSFGPSERIGMTKQDPSVTSVIRPFSMGEEFMKGIDRYCLQMPNGIPAELHENPDITERLDSVGEAQAVSTKAPTRAKVATPRRFDEMRYEGQGTYIGIPSADSERRKYVLLGFVRDGMIPGNIPYFVPFKSLLVFGVLSSQAHNAWMQTVAGRLKSGYHYTNTIIYSDFVFPNLTPEQRNSIEQSTQKALDARDLYLEASLTKLYGPGNEANYPELVDTHRLLDGTSERAYDWGFEGLSWGEKETQVISELFELYDQVVSSR